MMTNDEAYDAHSMSLCTGPLRAKEQCDIVWYDLVQDGAVCNLNTASIPLPVISQSAT